MPDAPKKSTTSATPIADSAKKQLLFGLAENLFRLAPEEASPAADD